MANYQKASASFAGRSELHDLLGLSSCEVSLNALPEGAHVPFVHSHTHNEEVYIILEGEGEFFLDGEVESLKPHNVLRVDPQCVRAIRAKLGTLKFICIQAKQHSLEGFTMSDAKVPEGPLPNWLLK